MLDCICALVPSLAPNTRLALLVHYREARKPTNTGLLAARALEGSTVGIIGDRDRPLELPIVRPGERGVLLFPADDAVPIAAVERADVLVGARRQLAPGEQAARARARPSRSCRARSCPTHRRPRIDCAASRAPAGCDDRSDRARAARPRTRSRPGDRRRAARAVARDGRAHARVARLFGERPCARAGRTSILRPPPRRPA